MLSTHPCVLKDLAFPSHIGVGTKYRKTSNISRTLVGNEIVDNSGVVGASPVGAAPTTSSFIYLEQTSCGTMEISPKTQ